MNIRNNLRYNLHRAQQILRATLPDARLWLAPEPGPSEGAYLIVSHPNGRLIRCLCHKDENTILTAESIAAGMVRCMQERKWPIPN